MQAPLEGALVKKDSEDFKETFARDDSTAKNG